MISNSKSEPSRDRKNGQPVAQKSEFAVNICLTHELRLRLTDISFPPTGSVLENFNDVCKRFQRRITLIAWEYPDASKLLSPVAKNTSFPIIELLEDPAVALRVRSALETRCCTRIVVLVPLSVESMDASRWSVALRVLTSPSSFYSLLHASFFGCPCC